MAAVQHGKKQKLRNASPARVKSTRKPVQPRQKQGQMKRMKEKQLKTSARQLKKGKSPQHQKMAVLGQTKAALSPAKGGGKNANISRPSPATWARAGRNLCFFSSKELQSEAHGFMRRELAARMMAIRGHVLN